MEELTRDAVLKAIADFDDKGSDEFFRRYNIRRSRSYFIRYNGRDYDMKAVTRIALNLVSGRKIRAPLEQSAAVRRRLERDDIGISVVHHQKTYDKSSTEGRRYWTKQKKAERDRRLARKAMKRNRRRHDGWIRCEACGFEDKERSMFDAHHLSPLAAGERETRVCDLAVLCPTCHRWAHAKAGDRLHPLPIGQVRRGRYRRG